jgi:hypothetical protein
VIQTGSVVNRKLQGIPNPYLNCNLKMIETRGGAIVKLNFRPLEKLLLGLKTMDRYYLMRNHLISLKK